MVVPNGIQDRARASGGNTYDLRLCQELAAVGWSVGLHVVPDSSSASQEEVLRRLWATFDGIPAGSAVLVDGLVASAAPEVLVPAAQRWRLAVLMHLPIGCVSNLEETRDRECAVLTAAAAVVTTSEWSRRWVLEAYDLDPARVHVARPGVDAADRAVGSRAGGNLLCVGAVIPGKGHDLLLSALTSVTDLSWRCLCVGSLTRAPDFVAQLRDGIRVAGLEDRMLLVGPRTGHELDALYAAADALVLASRGETYGMVVTEALARALPVFAARVGGVPEALGETADGRRPGMLLPPGDAAALAYTVRRWLSDPVLRRTLRRSARHRRATLTGWPETAGRVADVLVGVGA